MLPPKAGWTMELYPYLPATRFLGSLVVPSSGRSGNMGVLTLAAIAGEWYSAEMERTPPTTVEELLKKVEQTSCADMMALPPSAKARMVRANLRIMDTVDVKADEPKG